MAHFFAKNTALACCALLLMSTCQTDRSNTRIIVVPPDFTEIKVEPIAPELPRPQSPDEAIARLREGNARFINDQSAYPQRDSRQSIIQSAKQMPFASIMGCSDCQVPAEVVFDQGLGDLFIVRTAGQTAALASVGSLEFSVAVLGVKTIVVLGHEGCGAMAGAIGTARLPGHVEDLANVIRPSVREFVGQPDRLEDAAKANAVEEATSLRKLGPVLSKYVGEGKVKVIPAYYHAASGRVEFL
jgi:carbonic anhydrase